MKSLSNNKDKLQTLRNELFFGAVDNKRQTAIKTEIHNIEKLSNFVAVDNKKK